VGAWKGKDITAEDNIGGCGGSSGDGGDGGKNECATLK
jgi:hypothetical protein